MIQKDRDTERQRSLMQRKDKGYRGMQNETQIHWYRIQEKKEASMYVAIRKRVGWLGIQTKWTG